MNRPNWKLLLPAAAAGGFVLVGFWGLLVGPLGRALLSEGALMETARALRAGAGLGNDLASAQKRLIEVAGKAAETGKPRIALKLYGTLLAKYPDTQYADFVRTNMRIEENKLGKGSAPA